jgi:hypothetical protein
LEIEAIRGEGLERNRQSEIGIRQPCVFAKSDSGKVEFGSEREEAKPSDFRCMPLGIWVSQVLMGLPKMR